MRSCVRVAAILTLSIPGLGLRAQVDLDLERIRDLVRAGALPRQALEEAESRSLERGYRETLRRTLLSDKLQSHEIRTMLDAARGLARIVRSRYELVVAQVEAGVVPAKRLGEARDELDLAERQVELADSRANLIRQQARMDSIQSYREELEEQEEVFRFYGFDAYEQEMLVAIGDMFRQAFGRDVPVSAEGDTDFHRSLGLDHTGRIDVALHPDSDEGMFLTYLLESMGLPYVAFRTAVPGWSTGPHIHVGPPSDRITEDD